VKFVTHQSCAPKSFFTFLVNMVTIFAGVMHRTEVIRPDDISTSKSHRPVIKVSLVTNRIIRRISKPVFT